MTRLLRLEALTRKMWENVGKIGVVHFDLGGIGIARNPIVG